MKTDELFYELFQVEPKSLFRLVHLDVEGEYAFKSLTVKTTEKRIDGFCQRIDGIGPNAFLEIQGYRDPKIYWRALRELGTYYEQSNDTRPFILIILFLDAQFDPGDPPFIEANSPHRFLRANLPECFSTIADAPGILLALKPLIVEKQEILQQARRWKAELQQLPLPRPEMTRVVELLEFAIRQRFSELSEQEVRNMLQLTPLEETVAVKELMNKSRQEGLREGLREGLQEGLLKGIATGEMFGEIRLAQRLLNKPISPTEELAQCQPNVLKAMLQELTTELAKLN